MRAWSRREFLSGTAGLFAAGLVGCSDGSTSSTPTTHVATSSTTLTTSSTSTAPTAPATTISGASVKDVQHVVILFQENRSFDHFFGVRRGVKGFGDPLPAGQAPYWLDTNTTSASCNPDPDHSWAGQHAAWNLGANDGFAARMGPAALGYFTRPDLPFYYALADEFTLCDHYFCSVLGPTTPNRLYTMSATIDPGASRGGPVISNLTGPFGWTTYPERLQAAGISWRVYHEADDFDDNPLKFFSAFQGLSTTDALFEAAMLNRSAEAFTNDVANGDLPQVSWIVAPTVKSEHAPFPVAVGEDFTARIVSALMSNPDVWKSTVLIVSYDENGGFFDHVPPPTPPAGTADEFVGDKPIGLGFRVPTTVVSPWSRGGRVCSDVLDHTSTLLFLEQRFGVEVPNISQWRRTTCGDLTTALDFSTFDPSVPALPATSDRAAAMTASCQKFPPAQPPVSPVPPTLEPA